ncbi:MAG: DUF3006 domain-containing protein [Eubacteriales bacterium]|nr:DUF3006 domain-containing protein [Eubacteriales bacterium]
MKWIVDRIEGDFAVVELENKQTADIPLKSLPEKIKEGDVVSISIDENETADRKKNIDSLAKKLFK